ncbi:MAG: VOC family protein [Corynebacterium sp.]|uniref:VOC family protein n=1 Tax=Corynebacterium sp. TaxID=1720 RepID=UPI0026E02BD5|nr:VOC family protein [Corynebacterium sp.]MDO5670962.1 VOC family protein [Corynebacterium sp.]
MQRIVPNLWFDRNADEAASFYASAFPDARIDACVTYPASGLPDFQSDRAGETLSVDVVIDGYRLTLVNGGPQFKPTPAISFFLNFDPSRMADPRGVLDGLWEKLSEGGTILMPLNSYDFSEYYGWVADRYGVNWQLMLTDPAGEPRPFVIPNLMFCGSAQGKARQAVDEYVAVFPDARVGNRVTYPDSAEIVFSEFQLIGEWLTAMDSGVPQPFTFSPGVSLQVNARGQEEIDHLWENLSAVPEAERCGWLQDRYGVSWQIVPDNLAELMQRPGAYQRMLGMGKLIIDDF